MELRVSAQEPSMLSSVYGSDPDKKISDDDGNDRNHKHCKTEDARSHSLEDDVAKQVFTKPYRRGSKPFPDGYIYGETGFQSNETWKKYRFVPLEKDISVKFDQKSNRSTQYPRRPSDINQKTRIHQPVFGDLDVVRDRGRDFGLWNQRDSKFRSVDFSPQIIKHGSVPHSLFAGRDLPTVSNFYGSSWSPFGMVPGVPNGGLDMLHPVGLQGTFGPDINPSLSMGLARQRCMDFEEQGFCLRGDMCPMEHGVNRIVVEDVQSLSQFNLPASLSTANLAIALVGKGPSISTSATRNTLSNRTSLGRNIKCGMGDDGLDASGSFIDSAAAAADFYDPDHPLWDSHTLTGLRSISQPNVGENDSLLDHGLSGDHHVGLSDGFDNVLGKSLNMRSSEHGKTTRKKRTEMGENMISKASTLVVMHNKTMKSLVPSNSTEDPPLHQKMNSPDLCIKRQSGNRQMLRKPSQKAQRTLFVNGIPLQNNKRETILSHFKKFGEVTDIFIPLNSERAFVQFSKREEAEAALMASDAVMGNRFIKLWWANHDKLQENVAFSGHNLSVPPRELTDSSVSPYISVANKRIDDPELVLRNDRTAPAPMSSSDHPSHVVANAPKVSPPLQKKLDSLEVLKEELRKKQEVLDQKRNDFRLKLEKLTKQASGLRGEVAPEQACKKQKVEVSADSIKAATLSSKDPDTILPSSHDEVAATSSKSVDPSRPHAKTTLALALQESSSLRSSPRPLVHVGSPHVSNRFKLDNRPTTFKIVPPLPDGLLDVSVLKEHFSLYGDLSNVQLDDVAGNDETKTSTVSAPIYFTTRHAAENAFLSGKVWKGHSLQFVWLINSTKFRKDVVNKETSSPSSKGNSDSSKATSHKPSTSGDEETEKPK